MEGTFAKKKDFGEESKDCISAELIKNIQVLDAVWVGDIATGNRTYKVSCDYESSLLKVIRRYSQFEALRNILSTKFPECIVPGLPPKSYSERFTSDDSSHIEGRMRGLQRFLIGILNHQHLSTSQDFCNFLNDTDFPVEFTSSESTSAQDDRSRISKYFSFVLDTVRSTISGPESTTSFKNKSPVDFEFDKDLQKLRSLKEFLTNLHKNAESLKQLIAEETDNCQSFKSLISNLQTSIKTIETDKISGFADSNAFDNDEEEKKFDDDSAFNIKSPEARNSIEMNTSEGNIRNEAYSIVIMIEEGIDILTAAMDAIERRSLFRKRQELFNEDLQKLNNSTNEPGREKEILEEKINILNHKIDKINENLKIEVDSCLENIEKSTVKYISSLVKVRKAHLNDQKDHWKNIASHVSLNSQ